MSKVLIIGAGITGLTGAYFLARQGAAVTLIDSNSGAGGLIQTHRFDGFSLEAGPNVLVGKPELMKLLDSLGMTGSVVYPNEARYRQFVYCDNQVCQVPKSLGLLFKTSLIPTLPKLLLPWNLLRRSLVASGEADLSVGDLFSKIIGTDGVSRLLDPALKGIFGGDVWKLSARSIFPGMWDHLRSGKSLLKYIFSKKPSKTMVLRGGMSSLVDALQAGMGDLVESVHAAVETVTFREGKYLVRCSDGVSRDYERVLVTTAGAVTARMIDSLAPDLAQALKNVPYASIALLHFSVERQNSPIPPGSFGVLFPSGRPSKILGVMYNSELFPHVAPADKQLLTVCVGGIDSADWIAQSDSELEQIVRAELQALLGFSDPKLLLITRWNAAIPQYNIGHSELVKKMESVELQFPGLQFIGADRGGVGVPDRIRVAMEAVNA